jgi:1,4-alpha-glucan branching enzyme
MRATVRVHGFLFAALLLLALGAPGHARDEVASSELGASLLRSPGGTITGTKFRVWAPNAKTVSVIGSFNNWDGSRDPLTKEGQAGIWSAEVRGAKPGDEYMFLINGELERKDPRARQVTSSEGKGVVYDPAAFDWAASKPPAPVAAGDLVIYQLHPGTFHDPDPEDGRPGTLRDALAKLDHLVEMGVNCVLLMPVNEFPGDHSWGYNPSDQFAVESAYGGPDALKEFVKACHERAIAVHLDIVHNHYGPGDLHLWQFDGYGGGDNKGGIYFYEDDERGLTPWGPRPNFGSREVGEFVMDQVRMWFDEYRIDGLRWDSTINIRAIEDGAVANAEGEEMLDRIARTIRREYPGKISIAEDSVGDRRFDASWEYDFHTAGDDGVVPQLLRSSDAARRVEDIARRIDSDLGFRRVIYTENHDETGRLNGKRRLITEVSAYDPQGLKARRKSALAAVLTLTSPGIPLLFMGQELLEDREFHDTNPLDWRRGEESFRSFLLYKDLVHLRRNLDGSSAALTGPHARVIEVDEENKVIAFRRHLPGGSDDDLLVVINFSGRTLENHEVKFPSAGRWHQLFNSDDPKYGDDLTGLGLNDPRIDSTSQAMLTLAPYSAQIFGRAKGDNMPVDLEALRAAWDATHGAPRSKRLASAETLD